VQLMSDLGVRERLALLRAETDGWLTLTTGLQETILAHWHLRCRRTQQPFAVLRMEPARASLWLFPSADTEFSAQELTLLREVLADATGVVLAPSGARAFVSSGDESELMARLLAVTERREKSRGTA
jgi:hypothetical protein